MTDPGPMPENVAAFLRLCGEDPDKWDYIPEEGGDGYAVQKPRADQCTEVCVQRCLRRPSHKGNCFTSYWHGDLLCEHLWGADVKRATGKESM